MAATHSEQLNGTDNSLNGDFTIPNLTNDDDDQKSYRPPDIEADVREMERRRRVEQMITSRSFRDDLERVVEQQLQEGGAEGLFALQQRISDITGLGFQQRGAGVSRAVLPINDIRPSDVMGYAKGEKILRCKLAALYRLVYLFGWSQSVFNHITARISQDLEHFLVNPYGLLYNEITASSLVKVDMQGNVVDGGATHFGINTVGFGLHSVIHAARPDAKCIAHTRQSAVLAVSGMKCGFLSLSQEATIIGEVSYHEYTGNSIDPADRELIARNLGPVNKVMFLHNHGAVILGETIEEVFAKMHTLILACETQTHLMPIGLENLVIISEEARKRSQEVVKRAADFASAGKAARLLDESEKKAEVDEHKEVEKPKTRGIQWKFGDMEFEAHMRMLDNAGYRTGYPYRVPMVKNEPPRQKYDVEVPPAVSSFGYLIEEDELYKNSPLKKNLDGRRSLDRSRWINSPNAYQKVEILEQGSTDPKKITKWVQHGSPAHGTQIRLENSHQFVPLGTNPKEFKQKQKQIKENRRQGGISAGPQSHILEGVTWDEAKTLQDAAMSGTGEVILVGAASKGIIQRDFQHHAMVYRTPYAKNPFDSVTDQELEDYKKTIERKQKGIHDDSLEVSVSTTPAPVLEPLVAEPVILTPHEERKPPLPPSSTPLTPTTPTSPASDAEYEGPRVVEVATTKVPRADRAQLQVLPPSDENGTPEPHVERSKSARFPRDASGDAWDLFKRRSWSLGRDKKKHSKAAAEVNGDEIDNPQSTVSQSSRDESSARDVSTEDSPSKKEKKKKKGLRTPSFLKKKSKDKKKTPVPEA